MSILSSKIDHSIFIESISFIKSKLGETNLDELQQEVLERLIHSSGDFQILNLLKFSPGSCDCGISALLAGAPILTDTAMAAAAIKPMASRTLNSSIYSLLDWAPLDVEKSLTRTGIGMQKAWPELSARYVGNQSPIVVIGSSPTALEALIDSVIEGLPKPSLVIGMPVGFIGVSESKKKLLQSGLTNILLKGPRGGAGLGAATVNALMRRAVMNAK